MSVVIHARVIEQLTRLRLGYVAERLDTVLNDAARTEPTYLDFLDGVLRQEVDAKQRTRVAMGLKIAHFPTVKTLDDFDFKFQPSVDQRLVRELATARFAEVYASQELQDRADALGLNDRATDIWKPLLAIASVMAEDEVDHLTSLSVEMSPDADRQEEFKQLQILSALRTLAGPEGTLTGTTQQLIDQLKSVTNMDVPDLNAVLGQWFTMKSIRLAGIDTPRKAWQITEAELTDIEAKLKSDGLPS